jgi:hypothetical protein
MSVSVHLRNSSQVLVTAATKATGNWTFEASPLLQINNPKTFNVFELFISPKAKLFSFLQEQGEMWPFNVIKISLSKMKGR